MKKTASFLFAIMFIVLFMLPASMLADVMSRPLVMRDRLVIDTGGSFVIGTVTMTASSAELNLLDGATVTSAEINRLDESAMTGDGKFAPFFMKGSYTFTDAITNLSHQSLGVAVPNNFIIQAAVLDIGTAMVGTGNTGTLAIAVTGAADIMAAIDADTLGSTHTNSMIPLYGDPATWIKTTSASNVTISTVGVTQGVINVTILGIPGN